MRLVTALILMDAVLAWGAPQQTRVYQSDPQTLDGSVYAFFNHNSRRYDRDAAAEEGTRNLMALMKEQGIRRIGSVIEYDETYYLALADLDHIVDSWGGAHNLTFENLETIFFSGGHLENCLCEALRDTARGIPSRGRAVNFVIVQDATYSLAKYSLGFQDRPAASDRDGAEEAYSISLDEVLSGMSDASVSAYLQTHLLNVAENKFCNDDQYTNMVYPDGGPSLDRFSFILYRAGRPIGEPIGSGNVAIRLILTDMAEFAGRDPEDAPGFGNPGVAGAKPRGSGGLSLRAAQLLSSWSPATDPWDGRLSQIR